MLRPANVADMNEIFEIYMDKDVNPYMLWEHMSKTEFDPIYRQMIAKDGLYVYEKEKQCAAVIKVDRGVFRRSHTAYIGSFAVAKSFHNQGLGKRVMTEMIDTLKAEGRTRVELIVEADNPAAIHLYTKLGFQKEGVLKNFLKRANEESFVDDIYMALLL